MPLFPRFQQLARHLRLRTTNATQSIQSKTMTDPKTYKLNHSMIRIKDPKITIPFYESNFGMKVIDSIEMKEAKFTLYFLAFDGSEAPNGGRARSDREGLLELTHNYGTEADPKYRPHSGNSNPKGFGHLCFSVDNISSACLRLEANGVTFQKRQKDGRQKDIAFALDPDGYWIEIIGHGRDDENGTSKISSYRFNHTMIRIKDPKASLKFYSEILGMQLVRKAEFKDAKFDLYFLSYPKTLPSGHTLVSTGQSGVNPLAEGEGILELTHNYGTEKEEGQVYHNGNDEPQGFGHIAISVDDIDAACARFDEGGAHWKKRLTDGRMKSIAFVLDPDNYWVEVIQNETLKKKSKSEL